jgi:hypothetical protein
MWCIQEIDAEYQRKMMDVLEVYERPYDPKLPVICIDEKSKQLLGDARSDVPMKPGQPRKTDYEYQRHGTVNIFVAIEPKGKKRKIKVTKQRKAGDFAFFLDKLVNVTYRQADKIILVTDNLNIHRQKSLITAFGEEKAEKIMARIEWHYTPKHASWLDQAEIEINAISRQCLKRHIPTFTEMQHHCAIWQDDRNQKNIGITWQFTRQKAIEKLKLNTSIL